MYICIYLPEQELFSSLETAPEYIANWLCVPYIEHNKRNSDCFPLELDSQTSDEQEFFPCTTPLPNVHFPKWPSYSSNMSSFRHSYFYLVLTGIVATINSVCCSSRNKSRTTFIEFFNSCKSAESKSFQSKYYQAPL